MTLFEFLMAIASVVIAIALTEIFGGWGHILRAKNLPKIDWLHLSWTIVVVLYAIQYWVGIWPYRDIEFTLIYQVWFLIIPTLFIVLVSFAITPDVRPDELLDLREYYMSRRRPIFYSMAAFIATANIADWVIVSFPANILGMTFTLFVVVMLIPTFTNRIWAHTLALGFHLGYLILNGLGYLSGFLVFLQMRISS